MDAFFSENNIKSLFSASRRFIHDTTGYTIGDEYKREILLQVMKRVYNDNKGQRHSLLDLDKKTLDIFNDYVIQQLNKESMIVIPQRTITEPESTLIPPPQELSEYYNINQQSITQTEYIIIDSRERDLEAFPNPNKYRAIFGKDYHNVTQLELVTAELPSSEYNVNQGNNIIYFQENTSGAILTATITPGNYTISTLKTVVESTMNSASASGASFVLDISSYSRQSKVALSSDLGGSSEFFKLFFDRDSSLNDILGFRPIVYSGQSSYQSERMYNLSGEQYLILHLDTIRNIQGDNNFIQNGFCKVPLDTTKLAQFFSSNTNYTALKKFQTPLNSLGSLDISWTTFKGLYDFNGLDHCLTFKISYLNVRG